MQIELTEIQEEIGSLKELKSEVDEIKKTADNSENNRGKWQTEMSAILCQWLQTTCSSQHDYIVQQDTYSRRDNDFRLLVVVSMTT